MLLDDGDKSFPDVFSRFRCAVTFDGPDRAWTAFHCLRDVEPADIIVAVVADGNLCSDRLERQTRADVVLIDAANDRVLLRLRSPIGPSGGTEPKALVDEGSSVTAWGWGGLLGRTCSAHATQLRVVDLSYCRTLVENPTLAVCTVGTGTNTCRGDSGGPVLFNGTAFAITTVGRGCLAADPGVAIRTIDP